MLSRLSQPAVRSVRLLSLPQIGGSAVVASDNGVWMSAAEREATVAAFAEKQANAGIKSWNVVPQNVHDPAIKAGLGMVVSFQDYIPHRLVGKLSDEQLEGALNIYTEMKADGAKAYQIKAALTPVFIEAGKAIEAARTDQVPRARRFNFALDNARNLYQPASKKLDGTSFIQGTRLETAFCYFNGIKSAAPSHMMHGHALDSPTGFLENQDACVAGILMKNELWAHSGEPVLCYVHTAWTTSFVFEAEDAAGNKVSVPCAYPLNSAGYVNDIEFSEELAAKIAGAETAAEKHEIASADSFYKTMCVSVNDVKTAVGDSRPNPTKNFVCRLVGFLHGEGTPSQQVAQYQADQAAIDKFNAWQNEVAVYPASNSTLNDIMNTNSKRHWAKYNTQTIYGRSNFTRMVSTSMGTLILMGLL